MNALTTNISKFHSQYHRIFSIFLMLLISSIGVVSQDVALLTQEDVDNFDPSITSINGNLRIGIFSVPNEINDLSNLSNITNVSGNLTIRSNEILSNVDGLNALMTIGGYLDIASNDSLTNINGLGNLASIGTYLEVNRNEILENIDGLENVTEIGSYIEISRNELLTNIAGLHLISNINQRLEISRNNVLLDLSGLENLTLIDGDIEIDNNALLSNLNALSNLMMINGDLRIRSNPMLADCCGIQDLISDETAVLGFKSVTSNKFGCKSTTEIINKECEITLVINATGPCEGLNNGSISVIAGQFDQIPVKYNWEREEDGQMGFGESTNGNFIIDNLNIGTYNLEVYSTEYDSAFRNDIILTSLTGSIFEAIEVQTTNSTNGIQNGIINIITTGGTPPFDATWSGVDAGNLNSLSNDIAINNLLPGNYNVIITDIDNNGINLPITLLDEDIPIVECNEPFDMIILNDVSGSVSSQEYQESQQFFVDILLNANIGFEEFDSRASIAEWSDFDQQEIKIPITGDTALLKTYLDQERSFSAFTAEGAALLFAKDYLNENARPMANKVIVLSTDSPNLRPDTSPASIAEMLKSEGFFIVTIAFDQAFLNTDVQDALSQMSSLGIPSPGAPSYSDLDIELAQDIVNFYLCPLELGETSSYYFSRDGALKIEDVTSIGSCLAPDFVELEITITANNQLSIPAVTPVSFYLNNPELPGSTYLYTWYTPCGMPIGTEETFTINLPINSISNIYAVFNDDGSTPSPIHLPITTLEEDLYTNNIDSIKTCQIDTSIIQVTKITTTPTPTCDSIVYYSVNLCNIGPYFADSIDIIDIAPPEAVLIDSSVILNNCAETNDAGFSIPPSCCATINYSYDFSLVPFGFYNDQDVNLITPDDILAIDFDGTYSPNEDVFWDGTVDCPSTIVEFSKAVNYEEICDNQLIQFTFTINNEMNIPLVGLTFKDELPNPCTWFFEPYNLQGLSIANINIAGNLAEFTITEVAPNTIATFSFDANLGAWPSSGLLSNTAILEKVPDAINGGFVDLISNSTTTDIIALPNLIILDTIKINSMTDTIDLSASINVNAMIEWSAAGDGEILSPTEINTQYILGEMDQESDTVSLYITAETECHQIGEEVILIIENCILNISTLNISECYDNDTDDILDDDTFIIEFNIVASDIDNATYHLLLDQANIATYNYGSNQSIELPANGTSYTLTFVDSLLDYCFESVVVMQENCSVECIDFEVSIESDTSTIITQGQSIEIYITNNQESDTYLWSNGNTEVSQIVSPNVTSTYVVTVTDQDDCSSTGAILIEVIEDKCEVFIPTAFSPNGDNINDLLYVRSKTISAVEFIIFNRWGEEIFQTNNQNEAWDGRSNGKLLEPDAFAYYLQAQCINGEIIERSGNVSLLR